MARNGVTFKEVEKRLEDFLATDDMFVDYFNAFLALPAFPEPVCFNPDTGGFEVVSEAKKELGRQIKAAVRSQEKKPKIYSVTKHHSFCDIPLIPIEEPPVVANQEINTTFSVQTLNKEQGIHWIKAERLPVYLESECYLEYRLAHILSQVKLSGAQGCFVNMKIDYSHRLNPVKKETPKEPVVDPIASLKKEMFVCMGETSATDTQAWFSTAKHAQNTNPTFVTNTRPTSAIGIVTTRSLDQSRRIRPYSARPASSIRTPDFSDSGVGSPIRDSLFGSTFNISNYACSVTSISEEEGVRVGEFRPFTPRPSEPVCYLSKDLPTGGPVYMPYTRSETTDSESGVGDIDTDRDDDQDVQDFQLRKDKKESTGQKTIGKVPDISIIRNMDELSSVIVGNVLSKSIAAVNRLDIEEARQIPEIRKLFPTEEFMHLPLDDIEDFVMQLPEEAAETTKKSASSGRRTSKAKSEDSGEDSLLDSEDDFEEQDSFFRRRRKKKKFDLANKKGIEEFKRFISGTVGEIYWNLWIDIDKCRQILDGQNQMNYAAKLKSKYRSPSATYPLTTEMAGKLSLSQPDCWNPVRLLSIQHRVAEPLVSYWARRFLIKLERPLTSVVHSPQVSNQSVKPATANFTSSGSLLPLRPKSCHPRMKQEAQTNLGSNSATHDVIDLKTSPLVGMKRTYSKSALEIIQRVTRAASKSNLSSGERQIVGDKSLLTPKLSPGRARVLPRPPTANAKDRIRPKTAGSVRSGKTVTSGVSSLQQIDIQDGGEPRKTRSRCGSARSDRSAQSSSSSSSKASSVFLGGQRMEGLLQALNSEKLSGCFFQRFVSRSNNKLWRNNLNLWNDVQEYHKCFHCASLDKALIQKKAKLIFSRFIVILAPQDIGCSIDIRNEVAGQLEPPFDDLFDSAEEYAIGVLYIAWTQLVSVDNNTYKKVELIPVKRHLETKSKYVLRLQKRGLISERVLTPDDPMEGYEDPVYDETLLEKIPDEFRDFTLDKLIHNRLELEQFRQFLTENYANMDLICWMDIESYRRIPHTEEKKRDSKAVDIKVKYLNKKYFFGANSPAGKQGQDEVMTAAGGWGKLLDERPPNSVLVDVQKYVQDRLDRKWLPQFLALPEFSARQNPPQTMDDVIDDVMVQKRHKSQAVLKDEDSDDVLSIISSESEEKPQMLESKWVTSSSDIMTFRKALTNPVTSLQFRRYVSIKGDSLENDVLFWLEVQKYKELHHTNTDDSNLLHKINAIINCFLESSIPPALQVDIPQELADKIIDRKYEKGPYLFREAQLTVFRVLFSHWNDFSEYRCNLTPDKVLPTIERQRRRVKKKEREKQQKLEEQREKHLQKKQEAARRQALGLPPEGDFTDGGVFHDPFATKLEGSEVGEEKASTHGKDNITWTYSQYMAALETEDILNHLDESSLSSFAETGSLRVTDKDRASVSLKTETVVKTANKTDSLQSSKQSKPKSDSNSVPEKGKVTIQNTLMPNKAEKDGKSEKSVSSYKSEKTNTVTISEKKQNGGQLEKKPSAEKVERIQLVDKNGEKTDGADVPSNVKRRKSLTRTMPPLVTYTK